MTFMELANQIAVLNPLMFVRVIQNNPQTANTIFTSVNDNRLIVPDGFTYDYNNHVIIAPQGNNLGRIYVEDIYRTNQHITNDVFAKKLKQLNPDATINAEQGTNKITINRDVMELSLPYNFYPDQDGNITNGTDSYSFITIESILNQLKELNEEVTFGIIKKQYLRDQYGWFIYSSLPGDFLELPEGLSYTKELGITNGIDPVDQNGRDNIFGFSVIVVPLSECPNYDFLDIYSKLDINATLN